MKASDLINNIMDCGIENFIGVPDSLLKEFFSELEKRNDVTNILTANEGLSVALAAGVYLSTGKSSCVYMQNSGLGNSINPLVSLISEEVYNIPMLLVVGWRGEPGVKDEPQHMLQGKITAPFFDILNIDYHVISKELIAKEIYEIFLDIKTQLSMGKRVALLVKKGAFESSSELCEPKLKREKELMTREEAVEGILDNLSIKNIIVSTTGKISRELYELNLKKFQLSKQTFLTVGSMGHASTIALGIALNKKQHKVICIDGDGAALMHLGSLSTIGELKPRNFVHIVVNNSAYESVGALKSTSNSVNFCEIAKAMGYDKVFLVESKSRLNDAIKYSINNFGLFFIEIIVSKTSRDNLMRPKETPIENKQIFMNFLEELI